MTERADTEFPEIVGGQNTQRLAVDVILGERDETGVTFKYKDYRIEGPERYKTMTLATGEFIRRFLIHVLPKGFHRIRHYGLLANGNRAENIARARELLAMPAPQKQPETTAASEPDQPCVLPRPCPCCGGRMIVIEIFSPGCEPRHRPARQRWWLFPRTYRCGCWKSPHGDTPPRRRTKWR